MISLKFSEFLKDEYDDKDEFHQLYVLKGEGCVLYVGVSRSSVWERWFSARSSHLYFVTEDELSYNSRVGEAIVKCAPESFDWIIELWTIEDCVESLKAEIRNDAHRRRCLRDLRQVEDLMIKKLKPVLNVAGSAFSSANLPERIKRYTLEAEARASDAYDRIFNNK